ncbi:MAG: hypothetical protein MJ221_02580 [Bacilli bacterium]|nr:hypothetical protein [Bacilli bacterium]
MKKIFSLLFLLPITIGISSCSNHEEDQRIADEISHCAAIAQLSRGRDGVQVMFTSNEDVNDIYKPYNPPRGSDEKTIYTSSLLLSVWFELEENSSNKATLEWSFDKEEYINMIPPKSEKLPHATVTFTKYPNYGEEIMIKMEAKIKYNTAVSYAKYDLRLLNTVKE